jgi:hypothetical protein
VADSFAAAGGAITRWFEVQLEPAQQAVSQLWTGRLQPPLAASVRRYRELKSAVTQRVSITTQRVQAAVSACTSRGAKAKAAVDAAVLRRLQAVPQLRHLATPELASRTVWWAAAALLLPLLIKAAAVAAGLLLHLVQPGGVTVRLPDSEEAWGRLEAKLGYRWKLPGGLQAALGGDGRGATGRLAWLGRSVLRLLAAEAAMRHQPRSTHPGELSEAADVLAGPAALAVKAEACLLSSVVQAGPGDRSRQRAVLKTAELYAACMGAAYLDSGCQLDAARQLFVGAGAALNGGTSAPSTPSHAAE